jgi:hypothetical protein
VRLSDLEDRFTCTACGKRGAGQSGRISIGTKKCSSGAAVHVRYARWHMFEKKREAVLAIDAAVLPFDATV